MARGTEVSSRERHLVVVFDICSSTTILEDLKRTDNLGAWRSILIHLKDQLIERGAPLQMNLYKFIGDGWVLLFPDDVPKTELCALLGELSRSYDAQFDAFIKPLLSQEPNPIGLMFGIDAGELIRLELNGQFEYVGRAINVASRLQSYTKELPGGPSNKVIFSKNSFNSPAPPPTGLDAEPIRVSLRNISPATMQCFALRAYQGRPGKGTGSSLDANKSAKPAPVDAAPPEPGKAGPNIKVTDMRPMQIASLGAVGKWTAHRSGQWGVVVQFTNEARRGTQPNLNMGATTKAFLIYRVGEKEVLRVRGSWLDGYDLSRFNVNESHGLIAGVSGNGEFSAVETVRKAAGGSDRVETRLARIAPVPPKITLLVQLMEADRGSVLYEGEFAISTSPLGIAPLP
jgi:class 3 adenylate cyclase